MALLLLPNLAYAGAYSDVSKSREDYAAIEDLTHRGIFTGRSDGTFGPDESVNRAEAITIVVRAVANVQNLPPFEECFPDVHGDHWYVRPVCYAKDLGWVGGYDDGTFQPVRTVAKVELLKILLNAYGVDTAVHDDLRDPLAADAQDADAWYFSHLRSALAHSMTSADRFENLNPAVALSRGQVALMLHRFLLFREGRRDQSVLTHAERDVRLSFSHLSTLNVRQALYASARARVIVRGAAERQPSSSVVRATVSLTDGVRHLVQSYRLVAQGALGEALTKASEAYQTADSTDAIGAQVRVYTDQLRTLAHQLANEIRAYGNE